MMDAMKELSRIEAEMKNGVHFDGAHLLKVAIEFRRMLINERKDHAMELRDLKEELRALHASTGEGAKG